MESYNLKKFADELKKQRVKKKITLLQIKNRTRIDAQYLQAIEEGNFEIMPEVYIRAFIREYAESIGLNPAETLAKYESAKEGKTLKKDEGAKKTEKEELKFEDVGSPETSQVPQKAFQPWLVPSIAGGIVIVLALIVYFAFFNSKDEIIVKEKPYEEIVKENKSRFELTEKESAPPKIKTKTDSLKLKIVATDTSWIKVTLDGDSAKDFILYPGRSKKMKALKYFDVITGNSGGVKFLLNGDTLDFKGYKGRVRHILIDKSGIKYVNKKKKNGQG
jgi:cytoskeletal protein RodZ